MSCYIIYFLFSSWITYHYHHCMYHMKQTTYHLSCNFIIEFGRHPNRIESANRNLWVYPPCLRQWRNINPNPHQTSISNFKLSSHKFKSSQVVHEAHNQSMGCDGTAPSQSLCSLQRSASRWQQESQEKCLDGFRFWAPSFLSICVLTAFHEEIWWTCWKFGKNCILFGWSHRGFFLYGFELSSHYPCGLTSLSCSSVPILLITCSWDFRDQGSCHKPWCVLFPLEFLALPPSWSSWLLPPQSLRLWRNQQRLLRTRARKRRLLARAMGPSPMVLGQLSLQSAPVPSIPREPAVFLSKRRHRRSARFAPRAPLPRPNWRRRIRRCLSHHRPRSGAGCCAAQVLWRNSPMGSWATIPSIATSPMISMTPVWRRRIMEKRKPRLDRRSS